MSISGVLQYEFFGSLWVGQWPAPSGVADGFVDLRLRNGSSSDGKLPIKCDLYAQLVARRFFQELLHAKLVATTSSVIPRFARSVFLRIMLGVRLNKKGAIEYLAPFLLEKESIISFLALCDLSPALGSLGWLEAGRWRSGSTCRRAGSLPHLIREQCHQNQNDQRNDQAQQAAE